MVEYINRNSHFDLRLRFLANILDKLIDGALTRNKLFPKVTHSVIALYLVRKYRSFGIPTEAWFYEVRL